MSKSVNLSLGLNKLNELHKPLRYDYYLSGKINGDPEWRSKFQLAASSLRQKGLTIFSPEETTPIELEEYDKVNLWQSFMRFDITQLMRCRGIAALSDWRQSRGGKVEVYLAFDLGMPVVDAYSLESIGDNRRQSPRSKTGLVRK